MFDGLCLIGMLGSFWLFMTALNDSIDLVQQKSDERRERYRKQAYAAKRQQWQINQNRRALWEEIANDRNKRRYIKRSSWCNS